MKKKVYSPLVSNSNETKLIVTFSSRTIISNYEKLGMDVHRFFDSDSISLYKCLKTNYRFYHPYNIIGDADFYKELSLNRINYYSERWEHKQALKIINKKDKVLEIGSGFGIFLKMLKSKGIIGTGLELNPLAVTTCVLDNLDVKEILINDLAENYKCHYDVVCFFQVLEHITNVHDFIQSSLDTLKIGGTLIIGVPNNNPYLFRHDKFHTLNLPPHHAGLWNKKSLKALQNIFPLKMESLIYEPIHLTYDYFIDVQLKASKNIIEKSCIKILKKYAPKLLKKVMCKFYNGRNILAVYKKIG